MVFRNDFSDLGKSFLDLGRFSGFGEVFWIWGGFSGFGICPSTWSSSWRRLVGARRGSDGDRLGEEEGDGEGSDVDRLDEEEEEKRWRSLG